MAFVPSVRPVGAHLYEDPSAAGREMEAFGYYFRPPDSAGGHWAVYRFNAVTPRTAFAAAAGPDPETAFLLARTALPGAAAVLDERSTALAGESPPRAAIRDVVGWNTVWDTVNGRPYTVATRSWAADRFGGWFVWQSDAFFHAILAAACGDHELARWNLEAGLSCATEHGNLAGLRSGLTDWVDRSHPPIGGHAAWELYRRGGDRAILERAYPVLSRAFDWWFEARDGNGNGLLEYGSSPVGDGHFVHTKLAAMDESSNDNSPVHDEASFDETTHTLDVEDVGLNSLLVFEGEHLSSMARVLGRDDEAAAFADRAAALAERVRGRLWDDERGIFANRRWDGRFVRSLAPTSFYPLVAGVATRGAGRPHGARAPAEPGPILGRIPRRRDAARRPGRRRQRVLARPGLAPVQLPGDRRTHPLRLPRRGNRTRGQEPLALRAGDGRASLVGELQPAHRRGRRRPGRRPVLHVGRAAAPAARAPAAPSRARRRSER